MKLLSKNEIIKYDKTQLDIMDEDVAGYGQSFYYFRLGSECELLNPEFKNSTGLFSKKPREVEWIKYDLLRLAGKELEIPPHGFVRIISHERFKLGEHIFAVFGQRSLLTDRGFHLIHSPFIDPHFEGQLSLGLANLYHTKNTITFLDSIGKVVFFEIDDSGDIEKPSHDQFKRRRLGYKK